MTTIINTQTLLSSQNGEQLAHLANRTLLWHVGSAIARHPLITGYGLSRKTLETSSFDGSTEPKDFDGNEVKGEIDLDLLIDGFRVLHHTLNELKEFEDYDTRTGGLTKPFEWYDIPNLKSYIQNGHAYRNRETPNQRQQQASMLGVSLPKEALQVSSEVENLTLNSMAIIKGWTSPTVKAERLEECLAEMNIDPLYIIHQSALAMRDRARANLLKGGKGYIDAEILAFSNWTCRPQQGVIAPE